MKLSSMNRAVNLITQIINTRKPTEPPVSFSPQKPVFHPAPVLHPLPRRTPESQGVSSDVVRVYLETLANDPTVLPHQVMILRNGHVIAQTAFGAQEPNTWKYTFSACKSIVSLAIGLLMDEGKITEETRIVSIFDKKLSALARLRLNDVTVRHLLTMTSGILYNEAEAMADEEWLKGSLNSLTAGDPGKKFRYNSMNTYLLSALVKEVSGQGLMDYLRPRLWEPLGIRNVFWETCPEGIERGGWGLYLCPEDFAKLAQLVMQNGKWNGKQLISSGYIRRATRPLVSVPENYGAFDYGFQFWSGRKHDCFLFNGMLGQNALGFRNNGIIVIINAGNCDMFQTNAFFKLTLDTFSGDFPDKIDGNMSDFLRLRRSMDAFTPEPSSPLPSIFRKRASLPAECSLLDGLILTPDDTRAASIGLMPLTMQVIGNNYSAGFAGIRFFVKDHTLHVAYHEADQIHTFPVGFGQAAVSYVKFHGESQRIAVTGSFTHDEEDHRVFRLRIDFLELPSTRFLRLYFLPDGYRLLHFESPDEQMITKNTYLLTDELDDKPLIGPALSKLTSDVDYLDYAIENLFRPRIAMKKNTHIPPVHYGE